MLKQLIGLGILQRHLSLRAVLNTSKKFHDLSLEDLVIDFKILKNPEVLKSIEKNIIARKGVGNISKVIELKNALDSETNDDKKSAILEKLIREAKLLPNASHPATDNYNDLPYVVKAAQRKQENNCAEEFQSLAKRLRLLRTEMLTAITGPRSYYFLGELADLEHALIKYFVAELQKKNFKLISVPDILPSRVIENSGMVVRGDRAQVYFLDERHGKDICLSGTSEMALGGFIEGKVFERNELPLKFVAVSRCYRCETSNVADEKGIYRVHQFTKIEMFGVSEADHSESMLNEFLNIQESNFKALGLDFQILDMPKHELGAPAYRKYDIEAWFPGKMAFGEISSCSNCTDYQAKRLKVRVRVGDKLVHVHTVNGTACATPRTIMALMETHQKEDVVLVPKVLQTYYGRDRIAVEKGVPKLKFNAKAR